MSHRVTLGATLIKKKRNSLVLFPIFRTFATLTVKTQAKMRYTKTIWALMAVAVVMAACGEKKKSENTIVETIETPKVQSPVRMQDYTDERDVDWIGKVYHVAIHRQPSDSLPMVKDETGQQFVDNVFTLSVSRADGSVFFSRVFTKKAVASYLDDDYRSTGIFEGLVFDRVDGDNLIFAASVGHPQTDEYIPLVITLTRMGDLSVKRDVDMDTSAPVNEGDDEV